MTTQPVTIKNLHLIVSVCFIVPVAFAYGIGPTYNLSHIFGTRIDSIELAGIFRATMGLYLGFSILWIMGIFRWRYWFAATISNLLFMGGLAAGRLISFITDGRPSGYFMAGFFAELIFALWAAANLKKYAAAKTTKL